jgi:hypothetical protein
VVRAGDLAWPPQRASDPARRGSLHVAAPGESRSGG